MVMNCDIEELQKREISDGVGGNFLCAVTSKGGAR
jgi:hypothetical protein